MKRTNGDAVVTKGVLIDTLTEFYAEVIKPDMDKIRQDSSGEVNSLRSEMRTGFKQIKQYLESKDSPPRAEFEKLKHKVEKIESASV